MRNTRTHACTHTHARTHVYTTAAHTPARTQTYIADSGNCHCNPHTIYFVLYVYVAKNDPLHAYCQRHKRHDFECIILFYFIDCNYCKSNSSELLINLFYSYSYQKCIVRQCEQSYIIQITLPIFIEMNIDRMHITDMVANNWYAQTL